MDKHAERVRAVVRRDEAESVVTLGSARVTGVVVAGGHRAQSVEHVCAAEVQAVAARGIFHRDFNLLVGGQRHPFVGSGIDIGITGTCGLRHAGRHILLGHLLPVGHGQAHRVERPGQFPFVLLARCAAHRVVGHGVLQSGENLVAHQYRAARIAHHGRRGAGGFGVYVVDEGDYVVHVHVVHARQLHLRAEVVAAVAQHGFPEYVNGFLLISIGVARHELLSGKVFRASHGVIVGQNVLHFEADELHGRSRHVVAVAKSHGKGLGASLEVHGLRAGKVDGLTHLHEAGGQHIVAQRVYVAFLRQFCRAHGGLLCGIEHSLRVGLLVRLSGNVHHADRDGVGHVVDGDGGKLSLGHNDRHVALLQRALHLVLVAVGVGIAVDDDAHAFGSHEGIVVRFHHHLVECPAAAGIIRAAVLPEAERVRAVQRVAADTRKPVQVFGGGAGSVVGSNFVEVVGVVVHVEICAFRFFISHLYEVLAVVVVGGFREAEPFLGLVAVDVERVVQAVYGVECKQAVVVGCLGGCSQRVGVVAGSRHHGVKMFRTTLIRGGKGCFHLVRPHLQHGAQDEGE